MIKAKTPEDANSLTVTEHPRLSEFNKLVYPVLSRRAGGLSLGINLNPDKKCSFRCVYCQVDRKQPKIDLKSTFQQIKDELLEWLEYLKKNDFRHKGHLLKDISIAGDGEPTTVEILPAVLDLLINLKSDFALPDCKLVLFSNGTEIHRETLRNSLNSFLRNGGEIWFKLDFWDPQSLKEINRTRYSFDHILENLKQVGAKYPIVIQSCVFSWQDETFSVDKYSPYVDLINKMIRQGILIKKLQLYTLSRIPTELKAKSWSDAEMSILGNTIRKQTDINLEVFYSQGKEE